jgi:hypothetical protein
VRCGQLVRQRQIVLDRDDGVWKWADLSTQKFGLLNNSAK